MGRQGGKRQVGAARRRSRGHGLARLDGTRPRATVASKVMESGETAGHGNGRRDVQTARKRKRAGPKLEAGPKASAEQSEGTMTARRGETPQVARCEARQRDRPYLLAGDARNAYSFSSCVRHENHQNICYIRYEVSRQALQHRLGKRGSHGRQESYFRCIRY